MPRLAISEEFFDEYDGLEKHVRSAVRDAVRMFQQLTVAQLHAGKGLHLEQLRHPRDPRIRTIRITQAYRGVVLAPDDGSDTFLLVRVAHHDDAIAWARKRAYSVNSATGGLEVRNVAALEDMRPFFEHKAETAPARLFAAQSDTVLRDLGIDEQTLRLARLCVDRDDLRLVAPPLMPADQHEVLDHLAEGFSPEDVWEQLIAARRPAATGSGAWRPADLAEAIRSTPHRIVDVSGPDELDRVLADDFARWRVFLHPAQRRMAYVPSYSGPAQVTGGPGTGKTVAALHRVRHLLRGGGRERGGQEDAGRILLTTYTNAMAETLRQNLALLLGEADAALLSRVDVTTVDSLASRVIREARGRVPKPLGTAAERSVWAGIRKRHELPWSEQFLSQELRHVVLAQDVRTAQEYQRVPRKGRGTPVGPVQREQLWRAMSEFTAVVSSRDTATYTQLCARAAELMATSAPRYAHVVVDEAQDLHPAQWRVLRASVAAGPDDLFIVGDPHQRIYDSRVSLRSLGVHVTGRSTRLRLNYRSTEEILVWSSALLDGRRIGRLGEDDETGAADSLAGYRSELRGRAPSARGWRSQEEELTALVEQVRSWIEADDVAPSDIAVCARFNTMVDAVIGRLRRDGVPVVAVKDATGPSVSGVRVATMHAMKGLEFRCVAVVGVAEGVVPFPPQVTPAQVDPLQHQSDLTAEHCLLFVACTRARDALAVSWHGTPSPLLTAAVADAAVRA
ncbi:UvrD-helicase domain-containing protein [Streptomyces sp. Isolate_45]|uniref:UvrD-helicase domain-containing protein n=1 Tax=Streptomyces sp. Isolate_45 TaxID=2950111 RepID=UPI002481B555|nr:UvrD-helicase domain-containing protein [Streptomyces sp. Isolate_45]MDA5286250.1 UvrD-helicase domain-containing protein [Streptomyces sp. Isolate_45]